MVMEKNIMKIIYLKIEMAEHNVIKILNDS